MGNNGQKEVIQNCWEVTSTITISYPQPYLVYRTSRNHYMIDQEICQM